MAKPVNAVKGKQGFQSTGRKPAKPATASSVPSGSAATTPPAGELTAEQKADIALAALRKPVRNGYQFAPEGECSYCDAEYERGNSFFPPHRTERKPNCGGGNDFHHCTCSACF